jgi:hypothetical protein
MRYAHLSPSARKAAVALLDRPAEAPESGYHLGTSGGT